jgi:DNA-binding CsgD family transcriptional regulator
MTVSQTSSADLVERYAVNAGLKLRRGDDPTFAYSQAGLTRLSAQGLTEARFRQEAAIWWEKDAMPRFLLDGEGRIVRANTRGRDLISRGVIGVGGMILCSAHRDRARLDIILHRLSEHIDLESRVLLRGQDDAWCMLELFAPPELPGHVFATMRRATELAPEKIEPLKTVFGLTKAETNVLTHLTVGDAPKDIGRKLSMSTHTVRAHLRAIFMKMGVKGINGTLRLTFQLAL